jgi:hypothetical protein
MRHLLFILAILTLCYACSKNTPEDPINPPQIPPDTTGHVIELGKSSVLRNGVAWNILISAYYYPHDKSRFSLAGTLTQGGLTHSLWMQDISNKIGVHPIERRFYWNASNGIPDAVYGITLDGDQFINGYQVDTTVANQYVEILHYDSVAQIVEGRFQAVLEGPTDWPSLPDTIKMTEGKFHLKIKE